MVTTKTTTPRKRTTKTATTSRAKTTTTRASSAASKPADDSLVARTGRTIRDRPYTSATIAAGAATVVAAAAAGAVGAFMYSRRDKGFKDASEELTSRVKDGLSSAGETVRDGIASATGAVKDLGQRGADYFKGDGSDTDTGTGTETRSQREIAEEALTLKQTGEVNGPVDELSATEIKTGAVAY